MKINDRSIGPGFPPYIIAEISGEHRGSAKRGYDLIDAAIKAGADAVKLQCYTADTITFDGHTDDFKISSGPWAGRRLHDLYREAETSHKMLSKMVKYAESRGITVFASVFTLEDVDFVLALGLPAIKIASFELTDIPLIRKAAATGLPMIISTGMGNREEIIDALNSYNELSAKPDCVALLHCISSYPAKPDEANLPALGPLSELEGARHVVGLSDHSLGIGVAVAGVAFGACIVEKHITLSRADGGADAGFSLEPAEFAGLVTACKEAWQAIQPSLQAIPSDNLTFRKSLYVVRDMACGDAFSSMNVRSIRPAFGLPPKFYPSVLEGVATQEISAGTPLSLAMVSTLC